ncbi:membrane protein [Arthrobacter phage Tuck]|uniref:Membrane protein n=1 Tax=Arthrobacter phage Tuck TaxID=2998996 RepID=A0A9E8M9E9_9CAUD|nr:membrane protein [Arthrobacter phage Tuck]
MPIVAMLCFVAIVVYGPINLDYWTEVGLIVIGLNVLGCLGMIAENSKK